MPFYDFGCRAVVSKRKRSISERRTLLAIAETTVAVINNTRPANDLRTTGRTNRFRASSGRDCNYFIFKRRTPECAEKQELLLLMLLSPTHAGYVTGTIR